MMLKKMMGMNEKMHFALGNLLHDMDMAGYMNCDYFDIEGFFHKGIAPKQDYKVSMDIDVQHQQKV